MREEEVRVVRVEEVRVVSVEEVRVVEVRVSEDGGSEGR